MRDLEAIIKRQADNIEHMRGKDENEDFQNYLLLPVQHKVIKKLKDKLNKLSNQKLGK